ncbi:hypothetical protein B566_EDAN015652 [Ephemera danica]|nr:hypothetical protein B566_EDAN015652 [Ephemera danica]
MIETMQNFNQQVSSWQVLSLVVCLIAGANAIGQCTISNTYPAECLVRCTGYGVNGDLQDPGIAAANYLNSLYPAYGSVCTEKWLLDVADSKFPNNILRYNWLKPDSGSLLMNINELTIHSCQITSIENGAFNSVGLGTHVLRLAIYYNSLPVLTAGMTEGLTSLSALEWVGNGVLIRAESSAALPFRNSLEVMQFSDCGFGSAQVVANITGCQADGSLPNLRSLELSYNPGPGLAVLGGAHFTQLTGIFSLYLWNSDIQHIHDADVFDPIAPTIQSIDLSNNVLTTMINGTLNAIIAQNKQRFTIALRGNPWKCDCHLLWLQNVIKFALGNVALSDNPECVSPPSEAGKLLIEADMSKSCDPYVAPPPVDITCL